jgi:hypothetical protein
MKQFLSVLFFSGAGNLLFALGAPDGGTAAEGPAFSIMSLVPFLVIVAIIVFVVIKRIK